jgi:hypothetical protein
MATGAVVGEFVGGPLGIVGGAIVGSGVSWMVDNWGDDVAHGVVDGARDTTKGIVDGIKSFGRPPM